MKKGKPKPKELVDKYRPRKLDQVVGQTKAIVTIKTWLENDDVPHAIVLTGPSGCGKTTLARILARKLGSRSLDYKEINAAIARGIDTVREIRNQIDLEPMHGKARVWVIDEVHQMTKEAQNALLKVTEDAPDHSYIILCTTEPGKLIRTLVTRCSEVKVVGMGQKDLCSMMASIVEQELESGEYPPDEVLERIAEVAEGSARKALKILHAVMRIQDADDQMEAIQSADSRAVAFDLIKAMIPFKGKANWSNVKTVLEGIKDEDPEGIRRLVCAVCTTHMMKGGDLAGVAYRAYQSFREFFPEPARSGLVAACFEVVFGED